MELLKNSVFKKIGAAFILFFCVNNIVAQCDEVEQIQPTIMVIPWTRSNEDIFNKLENDENYRTVVSVIKNAFIKKDFNTEDFVTEYENLLKDNTISLVKTAQSDIIKKVIENTTADIIVKAEIRLKKGNLGNYVGVELTAEDVATGENLSNLPEPVAQSGQVRTENYSKLAYKALHDKGGIERFLNDLNKSFSIIKRKGRTISVGIEISESSSINLETEIGNDYDFLSDIIIDWVEQNAYKNNYHIKGNTPTLLYFDAIKIPLRDSNCNNFTINNFERKLRKTLGKTIRNTKGGELLKLSRGINGNKIYFTIEKR